MAQEQILTSIQDAYKAYLDNMIDWNATYNGLPFNFDRVSKDSKWGWWIPTSPQMSHIESDALVEVTMIDLDKEVQKLREKYTHCLNKLRNN